MGSKNLKAITVRGTQKVKISDPEPFSKLRKAVVKELLGPNLKGLRDFGTCGSTSYFVEQGATPIKNWSLIGAEAFPDRGKLDSKAVIDYQVKKSGCPGCPVFCGGVVQVCDGPYAVDEARKPEYETLAGFGPMCFNDDLEAVIKANDICDRYGMDTISVAATIAFAMECYERGVIGKQQTDGIELTWGNAPAMIAMLEKIVRREGFGAVLADGVKKAAERIGSGSEEWAIHIHGQEPAYHDPRLFRSRGLIYIVDSTPGRHMVGFPLTQVEGGQALGPYPELDSSKRGLHLYGYLDEGLKHATISSYSQFFTSSGLCYFAMLDATFPLIEFASAVTGWDLTAEEVIITGQRIQTLRQAFNVREGLSSKEFSLPDRIAKPPTTGPFAGRNVDFDALRTAYYKAMDWDIESGHPSKQILSELGLQELVGDFSSGGS